MGLTPMTFTLAVILGASAGLAGSAAVWLALRRKKKSAAELERERRLKVNAVGRITEGLVVEADDAAAETAHDLLYYRYSAAGVEYSAAQDVSALRHLVPLEICGPGTPATVKYDPQIPSNSIIVCERWSGLPKAQRPALSGPAVSHT